MLTARDDSKTMLNFVDNLLNKITMYRLLFYYLIFLIAAAFGLSLFGLVKFGPVELLYSTLIILVMCWVTNNIFAWIFKTQANVESVWITAMILVLIISPPSAVWDSHYLLFIGWAAVWSQASKYILAIKRKHIFNPAAFAVALTSLTIAQSASWWVGTAVMLPFVLVGGWLIVKKIQRWDLAGTFFVVAAASAFFSAHAGVNLYDVLYRLVANTALLFFGFVMLTEPMSTPPTRVWRVVYGAMVGFLFAAQNFHIGSFYFTPELALLAGNIFVYAVSPKQKYLLKLKQKVRTGIDTMDFVFELDKLQKFRPGQYLEWTLAHQKPDNRGNRRYFTIASSPTEPEFRLGVKFYPQASSFKRALIKLKPGDEIMAAQLAGDFTLPHDKSRKLAFIAGGIGITPFRSMIKYLLDQNQQREVVLFYSSKAANEINYQEVFSEAESRLGIKTVYTLTDETKIPDGWGGHRGKLTTQTIADEMPDYKQRTFYLSGPRGMVTAFEQSLKDLGIPRRQIKIDYFPGFA